MSAFAVIYEGPNTTGNPAVFNRIMECLNHRGPDGSNVVFVNNVTMGHWHFWTTPEEVGERQPLALNGLPFKIVLDGRIDNREELFAKLNIPFAEGKSLSDAALILRAYACWGEDSFTHLIGEFALVIFDEQKNELICARDHLGDRTLFYAFYGARVVVASESWAVANHTEPEINESAIVHYFALRVPQDGQTFFNNVYELLPAHIIKVGSNGHSISRYWQPDPRKKIRYKTDDEYAQHFLALLEESIRCRMRSSLPIGVLMSGGLDSTSVACLAARMIAPKTLNTISYVFDELTECDERQYIDAVKECWKIHSVQFTGDGSWTFKNWKNWRRNPNQPDRNMYRLLVENAHKCAKAEGMGVLLTGYMGDDLYSAYKDWIADLIVDRQFRKAATELIFQIKNMGWNKTMETGHFRRIVRRIVDSILPGAVRLPRRDSVPAWISSDYKRDLTNHKSMNPVFNMNPVFERHGSLLTLMTSKNTAYKTCVTSSYSMELRNPFRDRRLVEFILTLPAYQFYQHGFIKYILRVATRNILPEIIRTRIGRTDFKSLYFRGVEREKEIYEPYLKNTQAKWRKFLNTDWSLKILDIAHADDKEALLAFSCISYEAWRQNFFEDLIT